MRTTSALSALLAIALFGSSLRGSPQQPNNENIEFQILPDKLTYTAGAPMELKYLVVNRGENALYVSRNVGGCSSNIEGFTDLKILDSHDHEVPHGGCAGDGVGFSDSELLRNITDGKDWILLRPQEIYGGVGQVNLPKKGGKYRLVAELYPDGGINKKQLEFLSQNGIKILRNPVTAPVVTIRIK